MTSKAMNLKDWIAGLRLCDRMAVLYDDEPGGVLIQVVTDIVEPGDPFGAGVAQERYIQGTIDYFDSCGRGWGVEYADETSDVLIVRTAGSRIEPPSPELRFRDHALEVLEVGGVEWGRLNDGQLRQVLGWLKEVDAIPPEFLAVDA